MMSFPGKPFLRIEPNVQAQYSQHCCFCIIAPIIVVNPLLNLFCFIFCFSCFACFDFNFSILSFAIFSYSRLPTNSSLRCRILLIWRSIAALSSGLGDTKLNNVSTPALMNFKSITGEKYKGKLKVTKY